MGSGEESGVTSFLLFSSPRLNMKVAICLVAIVAVCSAESWVAGPYTLVKRATEPQRTRFFTGNNALDAGAAGAALGVGTQYFANQIFNPCTKGGTRGGTRNNNRNNNRGTNNRIFGGQTLQNGAHGFLAGFAGAALVNNAQGNPCGR